MADLQKTGVPERDIEQAITALKKGAYLLKYGRRGKPKFCPFRLSNDESILIWYSGKEEKQLKLCHVSKIIPGQRTPIFHRYPRPEKEYQSFSLIYNDRSLDLICKDKDEAEVWFVALKALISPGNYRKWKSDGIGECVSSGSPLARHIRSSPSITSSDPGENQRVHVPSDNIPQNGLAKAFSDIVSYTAVARSHIQAESSTNSLNSILSGVVENSNDRNSAAETFRVSLSSAVSSSSHSSFHEDFDALGDVFIWGEGIGDGMLGGGIHRVGSSSSSKMDALLPKALESTVVLDVHNIACGVRHAVLVTKQGEIFSWGEESGGRLGHGVDADVSHPKLINTLCGMNIELVACGQYHTCAVTFSGDLYTWGDGALNPGLLGNGSEVSHWIPKKVTGHMEGIRISYVSCGPWHTAAVASSGQLFTFGDGTFGALGHGDHSSTSIPREVESLRGLRTIKVACGVWHTAAVVEIIIESSISGHSGGSSSGKLFTWGDGDKGRLGHGDKEDRLVPERVAAMADENFCQVACGHDLTIALTTSGRVYSMGSSAYGQLGNPTVDGKTPACVEGKIVDSFVEEIACGSHHVAVLTSKTEVYTWGKGANGQLGHGDSDDRNFPTVVDFLKDKQVKSVICGSNFTAVICLHKWVSSADHSVCSGCHNPFGFRRKRHNCYNCGLVYCKACSSRKSLKASLAPNMNKPYRVCDDCFTKLKKAVEFGSVRRIPKVRSGNFLLKSSEVTEKEGLGPRLQGQLSRLSSADSLKQAENRHSGHETKLELNDNRIFPTMTGNFQWGSYSSFKASTSLSGPSKKVASSSVPGSRVASRGTSPVSGKSSPCQSATQPASFSFIISPEVVLDDSKHTNDSLSQEIINLRTQVEDLTCKSQHLEAELERTSTQLEEVTTIAADEAEKCKAAKEVIKSLTVQLKEMAERASEEHISKPKLTSVVTSRPGSAACSKSCSAAGRKAGSLARHASNILNALSEENHVTAPISPTSELNSIAVNSVLSNGTKEQTENSSGTEEQSENSSSTKEQTEKAEWVVHDEPGVYITLSSSPGGGNELRRVRFSRKRFTEGQAEEWWAENGTKVCERLNIRSSE
ncbi:PH, RCC1 and FYVE domains-containing protein 1-like [Malania oleifera]|uniref:PH, RCC1 and FYVE domains-containing protein 1-like n=1 Tax=Malania oleifera TaxID=397392 RepID=UPI0025ADEB3F|nr:PH, RCC1 and FYVE domains-containing protein 1-like [Malania oleifera]